MILPNWPRTSSGWRRQLETTRSSSGLGKLLYMLLCGVVSVLAACGGPGEAEPAALAITSESGSQSGLVGASATFSVTAQGAKSYQWQSLAGGAWANIAGASSSSYTVTPLTLSLNGAQYRVVVAGAGESATSSVFVLAVTDPLVAPAITTQPADASAIVGDTITLTVVATGVAPTYTWQASTDGGATWSPLAGATGTISTSSRRAKPL